MYKPVARALAGLLFGLMLLTIPCVVFAQLPSSPRRFVDNLDVRCYQISGQPPLNVPLRLDHLNPLFIQKQLPAENVILQDPQQLCVPVLKNNASPPPNVLQLIQYLDVKCYRVDSTVNNTQPVTLGHLNPLFATLPPETSKVGPTPTQLCVPVTKNQAPIPTVG